MTSRIKRFFDRHWAFLITDRWLVSLCLATILALSVYLSFLRRDWQLIGRWGNIAILAGVVMSLRRLFRLGDQSIHEKLEPAAFPPEYPGAGRLFNVGRVNQQVLAAGDARAQKKGFVLIIVGTVVATYGDVILDWLAPFS